MRMDFELCPFATVSTFRKMLFITKANWIENAPAVFDPIYQAQRTQPFLVAEQSGVISPSLVVDEKMWITWCEGERKIKKNVHVKYSKRNLRCSVDDYDVPNNREYPFMKWTKFIFCSSVRWFRCVIQYATGKINKRKNIITYSESRDPMRPASFACASIWFSSTTQRHFNCVRTARSYDDDDDDAFLRWTMNSSTTFPDTFYFHISFLIVCHVHDIPLGLFGR